MIIGKPKRLNPTIQVPPWDPLDDFPIGMSSPVFFTNHNVNAAGVDSANEFTDDLDFPVDGFSCDHFRMFEFKVRRCARGRSHDWTECPYAHPGEKARRRDPRKYHYSGTACPEFRKGNCKRGDTCEFAHGIFECWLHPTRYRTQPCKDGFSCRRRVCFFAHAPEQLRCLSQHEICGGGTCDSYLAKGSVLSPTSILVSPLISSPSESPPMSPNCPQLGGGSFNSMSGLVASMQSLQLGKMRMSYQWGSFLSGLGKRDIWGKDYEEEPVMERVESGRDLRAKMYAKLGKDNSVVQPNLTGSTPDFGWVSDLLQ